MGAGYKNKPGAAASKAQKPWAQTQQPKLPSSGSTVVKAAQAVVGNTSTSEKGTPNSNNV